MFSVNETSNNLDRYRQGPKNMLYSIGISPARFPANQKQAKQALTAVIILLAWKIGQAKFKCCTICFLDLNAKKHSRSTKYRQMLGQRYFSMIECPKNGCDTGVLQK